MPTEKALFPSIAVEAAERWSALLCRRKVPARAAKIPCPESRMMSPQVSGNTFWRRHGYPVIERTSRVPHRSAA
jgi:hypothetical protein